MHRLVSVLLLVGSLAGCSRHAVPHAAVAGGHANVPSAAWQAVPRDGFAVYDVFSPDGRLKVTVAKPIAEKARYAIAASQLRILDTARSAERVYTWGADGPHAVSYPIITDVFSLQDGRYVLLGWSAANLTEVRLTAWQVQAGRGGLIVSELAAIEGKGVQLVFLPKTGQLAIFIPGTEEWHSVYSVEVAGRVLSSDAISASLKAAPGRVGYWYTRPALAGAEAPDGRAIWIEMGVQKDWRLPRATRPSG